MSCDGRETKNVVLDVVEVTRFLSDVLTAAGLLYHGKTDKGLAQRIGDGQAKLLEKLYAAGHAGDNSAPKSS